MTAPQDLRLSEPPASFAGGAPERCASGRSDRDFESGAPVLRRSSFYSIAACSAAALLVFQASLNIFGSTDILPLTGVTLPFISAGGSSMMSCWCLLAFIKAADERTYAMKRKSLKKATMPNGDDVIEI